MWGVTAMLRGACGGGGGGNEDLRLSSSDSFEGAETRLTPLSAVSEAFEDLSGTLRDGRNRELRLAPFCDACALVSVLFGCLGLAFKFAEMEYVAKVHSLMDASKTFENLDSMLDHDVCHDTVRKPGSHSRNLRRVRQGLGLIQVLFEQFLTTDDCSLKAAAMTAYLQECAPFHTWTVRQAVFAGMYTLPIRDQLILKLNETADSVQTEMKRYIDASRPIIRYIDELYTSRDVTLDW